MRHARAGVDPATLPAAGTKAEPAYAGMTSKQFARMTREEQEQQTRNGIHFRVPRRLALRRPPCRRRGVVALEHHPAAHLPGPGPHAFVRRGAEADDPGLAAVRRRRLWADLRAWPRALVAACSANPAMY